MHLKRPNKLMLLSSSMVLFVLWMFFVLNVRPNFYNSASIDPLAMINVLFPYFWIILSVFALVCIATLCLEANTRWLHMSLLLQLSLMLYFTPFLLSGFSWSPDSLWHGGVANYMPEILSGSNLTLSNYARSYPFSFITTYSVEQVLGVDVFIYTLYVYPIVCIIAISTLAYIFATRVLNPEMAFVAMLLALPALHFIEPHVSPFSAGTVLILISFILLTVEGKVARALSFLSILILTLTHPISPVSLGIFLTAAILVNMFHKRSCSYQPATLLRGASSLVSTLLFLGIIWFAWTVFQAMPTYISVKIAVLNIFNLNFLRRLMCVSEWTTSGHSFIYTEIHQLNLAIYIIFLSSISILSLLDLGRIVLAWKKHVGTDYESYKRIMLAFASIFYAILGYMLFLASGERFLLGRGLIFYILTGSMCISMYLVRQTQKGKTFKDSLTLGLIFFLLFSFPIISYSKEAYNTFTPSAGAGLSFIYNNINPSKYSISMSAAQQLASYVNLSRDLNIFRYPPNLNNSIPDFVALRINSYFSISMRYDMSFEDNAFTRLKDDLERNPNYSKIYSNSRFEIYARSL